MEQNNYEITYNIVTYAILNLFDILENNQANSVRASTEN